MNGIFYELLKNLALKLGQDGLILAFTLLTLSSGFINLMLCIFRCDYTIKKRLWHICVCAFLTVFCLSVCMVSGVGFFIPITVGGVGFLTLIPIFSVRVKTFKITEKQRDLVKFIDSKIQKKENTFNISENFNTELDFNESNEQKKNGSMENDSMQNCSTNFELDFQHVKSVIARLDYFGLKECDKKLVKELESSILRAEKGDFGQEVKSKINDGLGALLKIMSKYGV